MRVDMEPHGHPADLIRLGRRTGFARQLGGLDGWARQTLDSHLKPTCRN